MKPGTLDDLATLMTFIFIVMLPFLIVFLLWKVFKRGRKGGSLSQEAPSGNRHTRVAETCAMLGLCFSCCIATFFLSNPFALPVAFQPNAPESAMVELSLTLLLMFLITAVIALLCWFHRTISASILLLICFAVGAVVVNNGEILNASAHQTEFANIPVPITIELEDNIVGADIWFNDFYLGKTPIQMDLDDLLEKLPRLTKELRTAHDDSESKLSHHRQIFLNYLPFSLVTPRGIGAGDFRENQVDVLVRAELNGQKLYSLNQHDIEMGYRSRQGIHPCQVSMAWTLPAWLEEIDLLLDQARLNNYKVTREWVTSMETYESQGWKNLNDRMRKEPRYREVMQEWARLRWNLDTVQNSQAAWNKLNEICNDADRRDYYHTGSPAGYAVESILPNLDVSQLVERATSRINENLDISGYRLIRHDQQYEFETRQVKTLTNPVRTPMVASDFVLAHAIWKLDELLDTTNPDEDNPIETEIVSALLRIDQKGSPYLNLCSILGGTIYDKFLLRHDWSPVSELDSRFQPNLTYVGGVQINEWFYKAASLNSEWGTTFRNQNRTEVLQMAKQITTNPFTTKFEQLEFLFLDKNKSNYFLAEKFRPTFFNQTIPSENNRMEMLSLRLKYLVEMQPHVKTDHFVKAYREIGNNRLYRAQLDELARLEPQLQFEVLTALINTSAELYAQKPGDNSLYLSNRDDLAEQRRCLPLPESAELLREWIMEEVEEHNQRVKRTQYLLTQNKFPDLQLETIAQTGETKLVELVLTGIESQPTPSRLGILSKLTEHPNEEVSAPAKELRQQLEQIKEQPLPQRS
ncbi:MAG: hypothetical protein R3C11_11545 [Planctomycetaceae bacterium]